MRNRDRDLDAELRFHIDRLVAEYMAAGASEDEARRKAALEFGRLPAVTEACRDVRRFAAVDGWLMDVRLALRGFVRDPGFVAVAILTLALGIGANTAVFSVVSGVLLSPLPYRNADQLTLIEQEQTVEGAHRPMTLMVQPDQLSRWAEVRSLEGVSFYTTNAAALSGDAGAEVLDTAIVSPGFFSTLSGPMAAGRPLGQVDDEVPVVVVSDRLARRLFTSPDAAFGRTLVLSGQTYTVVGVAGRLFQFPEPRTDVWIPAGFFGTINPRCCGFGIVARLPAGESIEHARAEAEVVARSLASPTEVVHASLVRLTDRVVGSVRPALAILLAAVAMVLLIACGNLVHLLLARSAARARETAIRLSLGASRARLAAQALVETFLLAAGGAVLGLVAAQGVLGVLIRAAGEAIPRLDTVHIDGRVLLFTAAVATLTALVVGLAPLVVGQRQDVVRVINSGTTSPQHRRVRHVLCVAELAVALVLLVSATLLGKSLVRLMRTDIGVSTDHVVSASLSLGFSRRPNDDETLQRVTRIVEHVRALPGVRAAGVGSSLPPQTSRIRITLRRKGDGVDYQTAAVAATPGYFSALQTRLVKGRFFTEADDREHPPVMIMSEATARRFFGDGDPIGKTMTLPRLVDARPAPSIEMTLVGVIADIKFAGLAAPPDDAVFRPFAQQAWLAPFLVARTAGDPSPLVSTIRRELAGIDPDAVVSQESTLDGVLQRATAQPRFQTLVLASLAGLALTMAAIGLYGVVAYSVSQRTAEIGIRMALGADERRVLAMVVGEGVIVSVVGIAIGIAAAFGFARLLADSLYGVTPTDVTSFVAAAALGLLAVATMASYVPARRATRVDPMVTLRAE